MSYRNSNKPKSDSRKLALIDAEELETLLKVISKDSANVAVQRYLKRDHGVVGNLSERNQCYIIFDNDNCQLIERGFDTMKRMSEDTAALETLITAMEDTQESLFNDLKKSIKHKHGSTAQYQVAQRLNEIEELESKYPLLTPANAVPLMGYPHGTSNPSRIINREKEDNSIFAFTFGNSKVVQVPEFQFNIAERMTWTIVPKLCETLKGMSDWGVYVWFTTYSDELGSTPAEALPDPSKERNLRILAGLYKQSNSARLAPYYQGK